MLAFAKGSMRTYMILKDKARRWNEDAEIQGLLGKINVDDAELAGLTRSFSKESAEALKARDFDRAALGAIDLPYEQLDQLTMEILMGVR